MNCLHSTYCWCGVLACLLLVLIGVSSFSILEALSFTSWWRPLLLQAACFREEKRKKKIPHQRFFFENKLFVQQVWSGPHSTQVSVTGVTTSIQSFSAPLCVSTDPVSLNFQLITVPKPPNTKTCPWSSGILGILLLRAPSFNFLLP